MFTPALAPSDPKDFYPALAGQLALLLDGEHDATANLANASALLFQSLEGLNWAGFYLLKDGELVVGPFQGKVACVRIALGKGVCGTTAAERRSIVVPDVNDFPGHIACDAASRSELVVPLLRGEEVLGVLDLDSPRPARFDEADRAGIELFAAELVRHLGGLGERGQSLL